MAGRGSDRPARGSRAQRQERRLGYLFISPMVLFLSAIVVFPLFQAFVLSLYKTRGRNLIFVGLANYGSVLADSAFWSSLRVSTIYTVVSVVLHLLLGLLLALFLNRVRRGKTVLRIAFLTPWMVAPAIGAIIWMWLLEPNFGVVNYLLRTLGLIKEYKVWLGDPGLALFSVILVQVWRGFPFVLLILLAGLQNVPGEEYEAASVEGASTLQKLWYITLPHLRYVIVVATTLDIINTIRQFDTINVMTRGGPVNATQVLPSLLYNTAFISNRFGLASATGVLLLFIVLVFSTVYIRVTRPGQATETV